MVVAEMEAEMDAAAVALVVMGMEVAVVEMWMVAV